MRAIMLVMSWKKIEKKPGKWGKIVEDEEHVKVRVCVVGQSGRGHNVDINKHQGICLRLNDCRDNSSEHTKIYPQHEAMSLGPLIVFVGQFTLAIILSLTPGPIPLDCQ